MNSRDNMRNGIFSAQGSKDSAVLFVAGDNEMKDHTNRTNIIRRAYKIFMALLIALTMMISSAVPGVSAFAANNNDTVRVATYDQLQEALEETKGVKEIVVDPQAAVDEGEVVYSVEGDENNNAFYIGFDEALTVSDDITITSADDVDVYFARSDSFKNDQDKPALLNIESEGNLNLDGLITMTGEEVATTFYEANEVNPAEFVFSVKSKDGTGEDNEVWNSDQALKGGFYIQNNGGEYTLGDDVVMKDINLADDVEDAEQIHEEEKITSSNEEEVVVEKNADAAENADSEEVAGVWEEKKEEATEEAPVVSAPKRSLMSLKSAPMMMKSAGATGPSRTVATHAQLKAALEDPTVTEIIIDESGFVDKDGNAVTQKIYYKEGNSYTTKSGVFYLGVDAPLTVAAPASGERKVTIKSANSNKEVRIARSDKFVVTTDENPAIFNVSNGTELELDGKVTMTGEKVSTRQISDGFYNFYSDINWSTGKGVPRNDVPTLTYEKKRYVHLFGYNDNGTALNSTTALSGFAEDGYLIRNSEGHYLAIGHNQTGAETNAVWLAEKDVITVSTDGSRPKIYQGAVWTPKYNNSTADNGKYMLTSGTNNQGSEYWLGIDTSSGTIKGIKKVNGHGDSAGYGNLTTSSGGHLVYSGNHSISVAFNNTNPATKLQTAFGGGELSGFEMFKASNVVAFPDEITIFTVDKKDASTGNGGVWTKDEVKPGGYFIHAKDGGTVTLNTGVELKNIKTGPRVRDAAPVYIGGENNTATFNLDGAIISGNTIGYGPSDSTVFDETISDGPVVARGAGYAETGGVRKAIQDANMTNTAGGVIFSGGKVTGNLNNGSIEGNKADAGGIIVKNDATVNFGAKKDTTKNPAIDSNIGWHHAGAAQVEDGGLLNMYGGHMNNNVAWYKGGAVVVTEFGTQGYVEMDENHSPTNRGTAGKFVMDGGTLDGNYAFVRAGAIEVESNGVVLKSGTISNNKCKSLGGGIYVEGDYSDYSYTLVINQGYIHNNSTIGATPDRDNNGVDKKLSGGQLVNSTTDYNDNHHKDADFPNRHSGNGGGVWLCPLGGTSIFSSNGDQEVVINNNTAYKADGRNRHNLGWGDDFYVSRGKGAALVQNLKGEWLYDRQPQSKGDPVGPFGNGGKVINGPIGMHNSSTSLVGSGIVITGNRARDGGGIAANGTVVMGVADDVYRFESIIDIDKEWIGVDSTNKSVDIELQYEYNGQKYRLTDYTASSNNTGVTQEYVISLDGNDIDDKQEGDVIYRNGRWKAQAMIPAFVYHGGDPNPNKIVHLYRIRRPGRTGNADSDFYDLTTLSGIEELHNDLDPDGDGVNNKPLKVEWNLFVKETVESVDGETLYTVEREIKSAVASTVTKPVTMTTPVTGTNGQTNGFNIYFTTVNIGQHLENSLKSTTVHLNKTGLGGAKLNNAEFALYKAVVREGGDIYAENGANSNSTENVKPYKKGIKSSGSGDNAGKITIDAVGPGAYLLFETKAPEGYYLPKSPWFMFVGKDGKVTVTRLSDANQGKITNSDNAPYDVSGNTEAERLDNLNAWLKKKWWKREWFNITADSYNLSADNVAKIGNIKFVTDPSNDNYQGVTVTDANGKSELQNKPVELKLYKYEGSFDGTTAKVDTSKPLANAKFKIYKASNSNDKKYLKGDKVGAAEEVLTSNADGSIILPDEVMLNGGDYWLEEVSASPGYVKPNTPWVIWVKEGIIQQIHYFKNYTGNNELIWANNKQTQSTLIAQSGKAAYIHNEPYMLTKVDAANREGLKDAEFVICEIWQDGSGDFRLKGTDVVQWGSTNPPKDTGATYLTRALKDSDNNTIVLKSDKDGKMRLPTTLEAGHRYFLFEKTAPEDYVRAKSPWLIEVEEDYDILVLAVDKSKEGKVKDGNNETSFEGNVYNKYWPSEWYYQGGLDWKYSEGDAKFVSGTPVNNSNLELINVKDYELPKAGGMGTYWFMIIGMMMMAFAATMVLTKKSAVRR